MKPMKLTGSRMPDSASRLERDRSGLGLIRVLTCGLLLSLLPGMTPAADDEATTSGVTPGFLPAPGEGIEGQVDQLLRGVEQMNALADAFPAADPAIVDALEQAARAARAANDPRAEAGAYERHAAYLVQVGQLTEAVELFQRALDLQCTFAEPGERAVLLRRIGVFDALRGRFNTARTYLEEAAAIHESRGEDREVLRLRQGMASFDMMLGRYQDALAQFETVLEGAKALDDGPLRARSIAGIGMVHLMLGDFEESTKQLAEAQELYQGLGQTREAAQLGQVLGMVQFVGAMFQAVFVDEDKDRVRQILEPLAPGLMSGNAAGQLARMEGMLQPIQDAMASVGDEHPIFGLRYLDLLMRGHQGELALMIEGSESLEPLQRALVDILVMESGDQRAWVTEMLADALEQQGALASSVLLRKLGINAIQASRKASAGLPEELERSYVKLRGLDHRGLAETLLSRGRITEAQVVLDMLKEAELYAYLKDPDAHDPRETRIGYNSREQAWATQTEAMVEQIRTLDQALDTARGSGCRAPDDELDTGTGRTALRQRRDAAEQALLDWIGALGSWFDGYDEPAMQQLAAELQSRPGDKRQLMAELSRISGSRTALLQYLVLDFRVHILLTTTGESRHEIVEIRQTDKLIESEEPSLNGHIDALLKGLRTPSADVRPQARALYDLLLAPVADALATAETETLLVQGDRRLRYVPFAALWDGRQWLVERYAPVFHTAASERLRRGDAQGWSVDAFGSSTGDAAAELEALPGVIDELDAIVRLDEDDQSGVFPGKVYLDDTFTKEALFEAASGTPVLHIASHFMLRPGNDAQSELLLGAGERITLRDLRQSGLDLSGVELLTLSACDTALAGSANGIEIDGLGLVGQRQGAHSVIASLWTVNDRSTAQLMQDFYRLRRDNPSWTLARTLRTAQLALMGRPLPSEGETDRGASVVLDLGESSKRAFPAPYFWAPFVLIGGWL